MLTRSRRGMHRPGRQRMPGMNAAKRGSLEAASHLHACKGFPARPNAAIRETLPMAALNINVLLIPGGFWPRPRLNP